MQAIATIHTTSAKRYLGQFCSHFAHKLPVDRDDANAAGTVPFSIGICTLKADDALLRLTIEGGTEDAITILKDVVSRHLTRFAFREEIELDWRVSA